MTAPQFAVTTGQVLVYDDVRAYLADKLSSYGYSPLPDFEPGPSTVARLQKSTPGALVFVTVGDGAGLTSESVFDRVFIRIRSLSAQGDAVGGERLALAVDHALCSAGGNTAVGNARVLYITRAGGRPALSDYDNADRYHYTCTYITETPSGL